MLEKVQAGAPLKIPAATYNAFVDAAVAHRRRLALLGPQRTGPAVAELWLGKIVDEGPAAEEDYTDARYWVRRIGCVNEEGVGTTAPEFGYATPRVEGDYTGIWVTATNLAELAAGTHALAVDTPVIVRAVYDKQTPSIKRYYFSAGGAGAADYALFAVKVWQDGGTTDGDASHQCDRTYKARTLPATGPDTGGTLLGTGLTPKKRRPAYGKLDTPSTTGAGVVGLGYYDTTSAFCLGDANETLAVQGS